ncbi:MAG TPA: type II toxin-antitoxin system HicA family toxin [Verrucomicrobiae bacterium]|nr:type II toxin-antitoxin system HicA family toxin [Verrucomicrobiae bacterium]
MNKIKVLSGAAVCKILAGNGFVGVRQRGSHIVMQKRLPDTTITVPVPNHRELDRGTLRAIIRQSQLDRELFEVQ